MCGIVGILRTRDRDTPSRELLQAMNDVQTHRGPDGAGLHLEPGVGLGHRRLSIIDVVGGAQPLTNEDQTVWVTFNGEIYNFGQLTDELIAAGHRFQTRSDTEVIVHAWEEWGVDCVQRFRGMFAFAVWDRNRKQLFLARDRLGIKPLYYSLLPSGEFIFGSELKALLQHPGLSRRLDPCAVDEFFAYGYVPEPRSILDGVAKLAPGHSLLLAADARAVPPSAQYWDVPFEAVATDGLEGAQQELIERLRDAVNIRLVSEVPLGAFLSGGVDSSAVVAMMAGMMQEPVKTCSISFGDPRFNEAGHADQVARRYGTAHRSRQVEADDFDLLAELGGLFDEPFADSSAMPTYRVCQLAREQVTVALSGDGGDENLAGYRRYAWQLREEKLRSHLPGWLRRPLFGSLAAIYPKADWAPRPLRAKATFQALARNAVDGFFNSVSLIGDDRRGRLYSDDLRRDLQGYGAVEVLRAHAAKAPTDHPLSLVQYLDLKTWLVSILHKVDRTSMAHALEVRVPILDHQLVEWMSGLPPEYKLKGSDGKHLFKQALLPYLPRDIMYRPKMGFSIPLANWFRGPLKQRLEQQLLSDDFNQAGVFDPPYVRRLVDEHTRGLRDNSPTLWSLLMFADFQRRVLIA